MAGRRSTPLIENVSSIRRAGASWQVRWLENGQARSFTRRDRVAVEAKRYELLGSPQQTGSVEVPEISDYDGTSRWWDESIGVVAVRAVEAAQLGDERAQKRLKYLSDTLATLSNAQRPHSKARETERLLELLIERMEQAGHRDAVEHATQQIAHRGIAHTLQRATSDGPDDPLQGPGDQVRGGGRSERGPAN